MRFTHNGHGRGTEVKKMWISKRMWNELKRQIKKCEDDIRTQKENTETSVRNIAKKILEQPDELYEEIKSIEDIEDMIDRFIRSG